MYRNGPALKKTNIQMLLGINYGRFIEYLDWLLKRKLVAERVDEVEGERIVLTPKGIDAYNTVVEWIKEMLDGVKI